MVEVVQPMRCGTGAFNRRDGVDVRDNSLNNMKNHPTELVEAQRSLLVLEYDIRTASGGPGQWRGDVGQMLSFEVLCDGGIVLARGFDQMRFQAWGVAAGRAGAPMRAILNHGRPGERVLGKIHELHVRRGDTFTLLTPGGAGFGDPLLRDPDAVLGDVSRGFVSVAGAVRDYGVAIRDGRVDGEETTLLRGRRLNADATAHFSFDPERAMWEAVFTDPRMQALNSHLYALLKVVGRTRGARFSNRLSRVSRRRAAGYCPTWRTIRRRRAVESAYPPGAPSPDLRRMSNFRPINRNMDFLMPPSVDDWLPERHLARLVVEIIEGVDLGAMSRSCSGSGEASYPPQRLLGLTIDGSATGVFSSRKLEGATYDSVAFRFVAANQHPGNDTIATFRRRFFKQIEPLFVQVLGVARGMGVLKLCTVALDGTKIHANSSRHIALSYEYATKIEPQLKGGVADLLDRAEAADQVDVRTGCRSPRNWRGGRSGWLRSLARRW